jgi:hypothetical protein
MARSSRRFLVLICGLLAVAALNGTLLAQAEYRGRMFIGGGPNRASVANVKIVVDALTTAEEVGRYQQLLAAGDIEGFYETFHTLKKGSLQFTGGMGLKIDFYAASEVATEKGAKLMMAADSRSLETGVSKRTHGSYLFLVIMLDIDAKGNGDGQLYEDGKLAFAPTGELILQSYVTTPKEIVNVKKTK